MQIFTVQDILDALPVVKHTMDALKDAIASAALANVSDSFQGFISGDWIVGGIMLIVSLVMVWRFKGPILGLLDNLLLRH